MVSVHSPLIRVHVIWHPDFMEGHHIANQIREHFDGDRILNVTGGVGLEVTFQGADQSGKPVHVELNPYPDDPIIFVILIDPIYTKDKHWIKYLNDVRQIAMMMNLRPNYLPVVIHSSIFQIIELDEQAIRWDTWDDSTNESREQYLLSEVTYAISRALRHYLNVQSNLDHDQSVIDKHWEKFQVFLSYAKSDPQGTEIAQQIRYYLSENTALSSFLDTYDIPFGEPFPEVIHRNIIKSIFLGIRTDRYSASDWCQREVIDAKRNEVPIVIVDCLSDGDDRTFPYLGNVPVVRMDPILQDRLPYIARRLIDEIFLNLLWHYRVHGLGEDFDDTLFMARPPELLSMINITPDKDTPEVIVYPDPAMGIEEIRLFNETWSEIKVHTLTQWLTERVK